MEFAEFFDSDIPAYAILSHRWQDEELSFRDLKPKHRAAIEEKKGYLKVKAFAKRALYDGHLYGWIDTICIDKRSSAELSEAINSMYRWYERAAMCYAYLHDVPHDQPDEQRQAAFTNSVYWKRCWLLQELLAPREILFLDDKWHNYGQKNELADSISVITSIRKVCLQMPQRSGWPISVAERMSWASHRKAARVEDVAYSLMGIFGINMPLLYGEGERAFLRLQKEIIACSNDRTIFAWTNALVPGPYPQLSYGRLLSESPADFAGFRAVVEQYPEFDPVAGIISVTSWGLQMTTSPVTYSKVSTIGALPSVLPAHHLSRSLFLPLARAHSEVGQEHLLVLPVEWYNDSLTLSRCHGSLAVCTRSMVPLSERQQCRDCPRDIWSISFIHPEDGFWPKVEVETELSSLSQYAANRASEASCPHYQHLYQGVLSIFGKKSRRYSSIKPIWEVGDPGEVKMYM